MQLGIRDADLHSRDVHVEVACHPWFRMASTSSLSVRDASLRFRDAIPSTGNYSLGVFM